MAALFMSSLLLVSLIPFFGYGIVYLDCRNAIYCPNETTAVKLTCKTTTCFLEWRIDNKTQEIDFNCVNSVGTTESYGASTANLTAKYQEGYALISDLNFNALLSINGQIVQCLDGYGGKSSCSLTTMSFNGSLTNITLIVKQSCATIKWNPPYHGNVDEYALNITPFPRFGICITGQCTVYTEHATITGLEQDINYTLSIVASACHTTSNAVTTYVFIERDDDTVNITGRNSFTYFSQVSTGIEGSGTAGNDVHRSSSFAYISQFSTGIEGSGIAGHKEHNNIIMWSFVAGSATLFTCMSIICHVIVGCVLCCRYHQKKSKLHSAETVHVIELFEMTHSPVYDHCIQTFNNTAYGQVGQRKT